MSRNAFVVTSMLAMVAALPEPAAAQGAAQPEPPAARQPQPKPRPKPAGGLAARVEALEQELAELKALAVQAPTLATSVQELSAQVTALTQKLEEVERRVTATPEAVTVMDELAARLSELEQEVERLRTRLAEHEQPVAGPAGGTGGGLAPGSGFELMSDDGRYALELGGVVQPRYTMVLADGADTVDLSTFSLRRARFISSGHLGSEDLTFKLQAELSNVDVPLYDYYIDYRIMPELRILAGQAKVPFTRSWLSSGGKSDWIERAEGINQLRYDRDIGVWLHGHFYDDMLYYRVGLSNGNGRNELNDNIDFVSVARVDAVLLGERFDAMRGNLEQREEIQLMVGGGFAHDLVRVPEQVAGIGVGNRDVDSDGTGDNVRVWSASLDVALRLYGVELMLEGVWRHERWGTILDHSANAGLADAVGPDSEGHRNYLGAYFQASYALLPNTLQILGRVGHNRVPLLRLSGKQVASQPPGDRLFEATGQVRYFMDEHLSAGASYTFENYNNKEGPDPAFDKSHTIIAQTWLMF